MTRRHWLAVVVVVIACGGAAFAATQTPTDVYTGLSAQRLPFSLSVAPDGETLSLDVAWRANCGGVVHTERRGMTRIADDGQFRWAGTHVVHDLSDGDEERQRLRLVGRRDGDGALTGVWRGDTGLYNGQSRAVHVRCSSGDVAFRVTRGGSTDQPPAHRDAAGHLVIGLATEPDVVAVGTGKAWVLGREIPQGERTLTAIDQRTGVAGAPQPLRGIDAPDGFAAGEGAAWVATGYGAPTALLRIDPRTQRVVRGPPIANSGVRLSEGLAAGAGGVWALFDDRVVRVDPRNAQVVGSIPISPDRRARAHRRCTSDSGPWRIAVDRKDVWIMSRTFLRCGHRASPRAHAVARAGPLYSLARVDARTNRVARTVALTREYTAISAGPSGVWGIGCMSALRHGRCPRHGVHRIDPRTGHSAVAVALPKPRARLHRQPPQALGVGRGAVWIVQPTDSKAARSDRPHGDEPPAALRRIDIATRRLTTARRIPRLPANLAVDEHGAWVLDELQRTLIRVQR